MARRPADQLSEDLFEISLAAKPLADLDARVKEAGTTGDRFLGQVYAELKAAK